MENSPFEDVFPIQDGDFPLLCLFTGGPPKMDGFVNGKKDPIEMDDLGGKPTIFGKDPFFRAEIMH